jgi:uncharacterized protein YjiS (DUF1127 family)
MINKLLEYYKNYKAWSEYRAKVRETIRELSRLTNHELNDIGISRGEIHSIAHECYKKPTPISAVETGVDVNVNMRGWV